MNGNFRLCVDELLGKSRRSARRKKTTRVAKFIIRPNIDGREMAASAKKAFDDALDNGVN